MGICKKHGTCCKEWGIPVFIVAGIFLFSMIFPVKFRLLIALMGTPIGMLIVGTCVTTATGLIFRRKMQVSAWEKDRPFNDGDDDTPDPYLFNPGPGATWGLRAFMPDVESYSFAKTPISWLFKQSKRKVAILLVDGTVSFPWFPVAWISEAAGGGTRIDVPEGWKITAQQAEVLQAKRDEIKNILPRHRSERQNDFMLFTDLIFGKKSKIGREPVAVGIDRFELVLGRISRVEDRQKELVDRLKKLEEESFPFQMPPGVLGPCPDGVDLEQEPELAKSNRDVARSLDRLSTTMQHVRKAIIDIAKQEPFLRPIVKPGKPLINPPKKK